MNEYGVFLDSALAVAYLVMAISCLISRSRLSGSLPSRYFTILGLASLIGGISLIIRILLSEVEPLRAWVRFPMAIYHTMTFLSFYLPILVMAIALAKIAHIYSRYS